MLFASGARYEGEFKQNQRDGKGEVREPSGAQYTGHFKAGQPHGHGRRVEANGDVYVGDWCVAAVARQRDVRQG